MIGFCIRYLIQKRQADRLAEDVETATIQQQQQQLQQQMMLQRRFSDPIPNKTSVEERRAEFAKTKAPSFSVAMRNSLFVRIL